MLKLSQSAASMDGRVATPASVASTDTNSQQLITEAPLSEAKTEAKMDDVESEPPDAQTEVKTEVQKSASITTLEVFPQKMIVPLVDKSPAGLHPRWLREVRVENVVVLAIIFLFSLTMG